jgi:beta-1,4-N-acetylglucosaminyltransferase
MRDVLLISSGGGHFDELSRILNNEIKSRVIGWVINDRSVRNEAFDLSLIHIVHAERDLRVLWNVIEFVLIFLKYRPRFIISTGAGPAVPAALVAKLFNCKVIYIETISSVTRLSLTGEIMLWISDHFFVQWFSLSQFLMNSKKIGVGKVRFEGSILDT